MSGLPVAAQLHQREHQVLVAGRGLDPEPVEHVPQARLAAVFAGEDDPSVPGVPVVRERAEGTC